MRFAAPVLVLALPLLACAAPAAKPRGGQLTSPAVEAPLKAELVRYGLKAWAYENGGETIRALHYAPRAQGTERFPLIVYIPGNGEIGEPVRQFRARHLFDRVTGAEFQRRHPCHLLALSPPVTARTLLGGLPHRPTEMQRLLHDCIKALVHRHAASIDPDRIYLTGYSYGGSGVSALALHYPAEFAAVVPIAGLPPLVEFFDEAHPGNWWFFYNEGDFASRDLVPQELLDFRDRTNKAGGDFRIGSYPELGHDAWTKAWRDETVWEWLFSKSLKRQRLRARRGTAPLNLSCSICTASVPGADTGSGPERVVDGLDETGYRPALPFMRKDWWMAVLPHPVAGRIELRSGDRFGNHRLGNGFVEVSSDGRRWVRAGSFSAETGICSFTRTTRFSYIRVRVGADDTPTFILRRLSAYKTR